MDIMFSESIYLDEMNQFNQGMNVKKQFIKGIKKIGGSIDKSINQNK